MGCPVPVHCRHCNEALDVYQPLAERFCSPECADEFRLDHPGVLERDEAIEAARSVA